MADCTIYTDGSTAPGNPGPSGYGFFLITDNAQYDGYGAVGVKCSNNEAELTAVIKALTTAMELLPDTYTIHVHSDSKYFVDNLKYVEGWEKNNWLSKATGQPIRNVELWKQLHALSKSLDTRLTISWLKGHSGIPGNEAADLNANKGRLLLLDNKLEGVLVQRETTDSSKVSSSSIATLDGDGFVDIPDVYKEPTKRKVEKHDPINSLFFGKRWFFYTNTPRTTADGKRHCYLMTNYIDSSDLNNKNLGKRTPDSHYGIVFTDSPMVVLDSIRDKFDNSLRETYSPVIVDMAVVTKKEIWETLSITGNTYIEMKGTLAVLPDSAVLAEIKPSAKAISVGEIVDPPLSSYKLDRIYGMGFTLFENINNKAPELTIVDITPEIFVTNPKGKMTITSHFGVGVKTLTLSNVSLGNGKTTTVTLFVGLDIPGRNNFSNAIKQKNELSVQLILYDVTDSSYRLATSVHGEGLAALYYSPDTNLRLTLK